MYFDHALYSTSPLLSARSPAVADYDRHTIQGISGFELLSTVKGMRRYFDQNRKTIDIMHWKKGIQDLVQIFAWQEWNLNAAKVLFRKFLLIESVFYQEILSGQHNF